MPRPSPHAKEQPRAHRRSGWRLVVPLVAALAGVLFVVSAVSSEGSDLRSANTDLGTVVQERTDKVADQRAQVNALRREVEELSDAVTGKAVDRQRRRAQAAAGPAGFSEVSGPGLRVSLDDAPRSVKAPGLDPNLLVVHQQDIQAFVNALWEGGATAITLQGQRLISTTGVKCVGNTVVLDGVPYSPPYVIEAVGEPQALYHALDTSPDVQTYRDYVERYKLGLSTSTVSKVTAKAYDGGADLSYAKAMG